MINVFAYLNYRHFLWDFYAEKKAENPDYSYRVFNKRAGIKSPSFFKQVCDGNRNLTDAMARACIKGLKLDRRSGQFFAELVKFNQAKTHEERDKRYRTLSYFQEYQRIKNIEVHQFEFYSRWYHAVILEMTRLKAFREDPVWIAARCSPPISEEEARESLTLLVSLGLLERDAKRRLKPAARTFATAPEVFDVAVTNFHHNMLKLAERNLIEEDGSCRDISSVTVALDKPAFEEAKRRLRDFRRELNVLLSRVKEPDHVYQLNLQIFSLTRIVWTELPHA